MKLRTQAFKLMRFVMLIKPSFTYFHLVLCIYEIPTNSKVYRYSQVTG
jgi:hypothetical protein